MEVYEARLESFGVVKSGKKRISTAKGGRPIWPHSDPSPEKLATAGFYWDSNDASTDRVTCCLCQTVLDGWEPSDDPIKEHYNYSPQCGIAIHAQIEQNMEDGVPVENDPTSEAMVLARKATFRDLWPHEKKRAWVCKTQKVAEAGWYYCPTSESDDFVKCAYCGLSLDGWEPKDKPLEEHQRRSENCIFFTFSKPAKAKGGRAKKSRASKASRLSTQSTATTLDDTGTIDESINEGDTVLTTATDMTQASTTTKAKKGGRAKKGKAKGKAAPVTESAPASSMLEPEDDDFEVKVEASPKRQTRAKKRKSGEIDEDDVPSEAPAPKKQATRARSSTVKPEGDESMAQGSVEISMSEAPESSAKSTPKKGGKRTARSRAASTRKASTRKASKATKSAPTPADEELNAALEADLDRSLIEVIEPRQKPAPKSRAASKAKLTKAAAATATATPDAEAEMPIGEPERTERESTVGMETFQTANEGPSSVFNDDEPLPPIKNPKQRGAKKGKKAEEVAVVAVKETIDAEVETGAATPTKVATIPAAEEAPARPKGRQPSRKASRQVSRQTSRQASRQKAKAPEPEPEPELEQEPEHLETSIRIEVPEMVSAEVTMIHDPTVLEQEAASEKPKRGKKAGAGTGKSKKAKATETVEDNTEDVVEVAPPVPVVELVSEPEMEKASSPKPTKAKATRGRPKGKKSTTMEASAEEAAPKEAPEQIEAAPEPDIEPEPVPAPTKEASATPVKSKSASTQQFPSPTPSPQSSDAENHPPSSRPSATRPPLVPSSPVATRQALAVSTPTAARVNLNASKLATTFLWTSVDLDYVLSGTPGAANQENVDMVRFVKAGLTSPEKQMTVEDWVRHQATLGQERLRAECECTVQKFENEGVRALKALEGIVAQE